MKSGFLSKQAGQAGKGLGVVIALLGGVMTGASQELAQASVGFFEHEIQPGLNFVGNPFEGQEGGNTIASTFGEVPEGTAVYKLVEGDGDEGTPASELPNLEALVNALSGGGGGGTVSISLNENGVVVDWDGTLLAADRVDGDYEVVDATPPLELEAAEGLRFFRVEGGDSGGSNDISGLRFVKNGFRFGGWADPDQTLSPGEGVVVYNPTEEPFTVTFSGELLEGSLENPVPLGLSLRSSMVPQAGGVTSRLELEALAGTRLFLWRDGGLREFTAEESDGETNGEASGVSWSPSEPEVEQGEAFLLSAPEAFTWQREFEVSE